MSDDMGGYHEHVFKLAVSDDLLDAKFLVGTEWRVVDVLIKVDNNSIVTFTHRVELEGVDKRPFPKEFDEEHGG